MISHKYSLVIPMGGDGTLSAWIDNLVEEVMRQDGLGEVEEAVGRLPVIGYGKRDTCNWNSISWNYLHIRHAIHT